MIFSHLMIDAPKYFSTPFICRGMFCPHLHAAEMLDADGDFDARLMRVLVAERLLDNNPYDPVEYCARHRFRHGRELSLALTELAGVRGTDLGELPSPPIVFMVGTFDVASVLAELGPDCDFALDHPRVDEADFPDRAVLRKVPAALVREMIATRLAPMGRAIRKLVALGFDQIFLHSVTPPTPSDARYYRFRQIAAQVSVRSKVIVSFNDQLAKTAADNGAAFLDMWDETSEAGVLAQRYVLDGDHFNKAAAVLTVDKLIERMADRADDPVPIAEHQQLSAVFSIR